MRAIRFEAFGDPSVLDLAEVASPPRDEATALAGTMLAWLSQARANGSAPPCGAPDTLKRDLSESAVVLDALTPGFIAGEFRAAPIAETCPLADAQTAYRNVAAGADGRIVLRPQE